MRSNPISISVRLPQDPQASDIFSVISLYSRILTWITAVPIRHFFHPPPASQVVLEPGAVTAWSPWRNVRELVQGKNKIRHTQKKKYQYPNDCKDVPLTEMEYLDANKLETPQNSSQVKMTSNASINLQKSKAHKHDYKACMYLVWKKKIISCAFSFSVY